MLGPSQERAAWEAERQRLLQDAQACRTRWRAAESRAEQLAAGASEATKPLMQQLAAARRVAEESARREREFSERAEGMVAQARAEAAAAVVARDEAARQARQAREAQQQAEAQVAELQGALLAPVRA